MTDFIHIISTRFNVPTEVWTKTRDGKKPLSEEWLKHRFHIFQQYTLPSFINQTNKKFVWLVFFDENTPKEYKDIIASIQKRFPTFSPIFVKDFNHMRETLIKTIPTLYKSSTEYVITTDIDNDDMIHKDFVETLQSLYQPKHDLVIDLRKGLQVTLKNTDTSANVFFMAYSPFISIVEHKDNVQCVIKENHVNYRQYRDVAFNDSDILFIQIVHENNMVNNTKKSKRVYTINESDFGLNNNAKTFKIPFLKTFIYNIKRYFTLAIERL